jgi:phospholipid/cholesterol/gamma-HCH transport system substrate-binding protein/paraquat-inducible protein B
MNNKSKHFKIGIFVIGSLILLLVFIILLGASVLFEKRILVETYFDESVHGLAVGSIVKYRGVSVGSIKSISFVHDEYKLELNSPEFNKGRYVLVTMSLQDIFKVSEKDLNLVIQTMIEEGLRVKITSQGLTGTSYLEINYVDPVSNPAMVFSWKPKNIVIPSSRSTFTRIGASIDDLIQKIDRANIDKFIINLDKLITTIDKAVSDAQIEELSKNTNLLLVETRQTNQDIRKILGAQGMQKLPEKIEDTLGNINKSMNKLNQMLSTNQGEISSTVENLKVVSQDLREVSNNAKKYPSMLIFGDAPNAPIYGKNRQ